MTEVVKHATGVFEESFWHETGAMELNGERKPIAGVSIQKKALIYTKANLSQNQGAGRRLMSSSCLRKSGRAQFGLGTVTVETGWQNCSVRPEGEVNCNVNLRFRWVGNGRIPPVSQLLAYETLR